MMSIKEFSESMKNIERNILDFIDNEDNIEENYQNLKHLLLDQEIEDDKYKLISLFHLITKIANNKHRENFFYDRIDKILKIFIDDIKKQFRNSEIINIFKSNKRILLFLIEEKALIVDVNFAKMVTTVDKFVSSKYPEYFSKEIQLFEKEDWFPTKLFGHYTIEGEWIEEKKELPENFDELRKQCENESFICQLIRNDSIKDFITYVKKNDFSLNAQIETSIYETNDFFFQKVYIPRQRFFFNFNNYKKSVTLIEYAAFFGSIQIFKYLMNNGVVLSGSLWLYAIHGNNSEIINILDENRIEPEKNINNKNDELLYEKCFIESVKCHHNELANYIKNNYLENEMESNKSHSFTSKKILINALKYYNFDLIDDDLIDSSIFFYLCNYDYPLFVVDVLKNKNIDEEQYILIKNFL